MARRVLISDALAPAGHSDTAPQAEVHLGVRPVFRRLQRVVIIALDSSYFAAASALTHSATSSGPR